MYIIALWLVFFPRGLIGTFLDDVNLPPFFSVEMVESDNKEDSADENRV